MAYSEILAERVRGALAHVAPVEEKKMFNGLTFMVNGKMCVGVSKEELMCRIDPALHEAAVARPGCRTMDMQGKVYRGYVFVSQNALGSDAQLAEWIQQALDFNRVAKAAKKKKKE